MSHSHVSVFRGRGGGSGGGCPGTHVTLIVMYLTAKGINDAQGHVTVTVMYLTARGITDAQGHVSHLQSCT